MFIWLLPDTRVVRYCFRVALIQLIGTPSLRFSAAPDGLPEVVWGVERDCRII
jgi:hypothetical protein